MSFATSTPLPALMLAAFATLAVTGCGLSVSFDDGDATRRTIDETLAADGLRGLRLDTDNGAVEIRTGSDDDVDVRVMMQERHEGDADYRIDVEGDHVVIDGECDGGWFDNCSVGFVVTVPSGFTVDATTENGRIDVVDVAGDVRLRTNNGAIDADRLHARAVDAHTDNGRVRLGFGAVPSDVNVESDNGAIDVRLPGTDDTYDVDADSDNGAVDVDVRTASDAGRAIVARSDNGSIDITYART